MTKGKLTNVIGDVTNPQRVEPNEVVFLPHVCNDLGGWGKGVVLAISKKWKGAENIYHAFIAKHGKGKKVLKSTGFWDSNENGVMDNVVVCNMIAQSGYKSEDNPRPLKYDALVKCMKDVADQIDQHHKELMSIVGFVPIRIHCPKFGSDLAGGNWEFITCLIEDLWLARGIDVVVYEYGG